MVLSHEIEGSNPFGATTPRVASTDSPLFAEDIRNRPRSEIRSGLHHIPEWFAVVPHHTWLAVSFTPRIAQASAQQFALLNWHSIRTGMSAGVVHSDVVTLADPEQDACLTSQRGGGFSHLPAKHRETQRISSPLGSRISSKPVPSLCQEPPVGSRGSRPQCGVGIWSLEGRCSDGQDCGQCQS